ncbi:hypothetical protein HRbin01_01168 [archaeon HR01]|nr:hypothetical protein HRbin01_01168 [archaeon HR01]
MKSPSLAFAGVVTSVFGLFIIITGLPFGIAFLMAGIIMFVLAYILPPPQPPTPDDPGKKLCWFCYREIPADSKTCPYCRLRQDSIRDN